MTSEWHPGVLPTSKLRSPSFTCQDRGELQFWKASSANDTPIGRQLAYDYRICTYSATCVRTANRAPACARLSTLYVSPLLYTGGEGRSAESLRPATRTQT